MIVLVDQIQLRINVYGPNFDGENIDEFDKLLANFVKMLFPIAVWADTIH